MIVDIDKKIAQSVASLEQNYVTQDVFNAFIAQFPEDWKKHKIAYSKFNRSKQFGKTIPLPKPEVSLKRMIQIWMQKNK